MTVIFTDNGKRISLTRDPYWYEPRGCYLAIGFLWNEAKGFWDMPKFHTFNSYVGGR